MPILWPLAAKLQPVLWQQRPIWTANCPIPELPVLPWEDVDRPPVVFGRYDAPPIAALTVPTNFGLAALRLVSQSLNSFLHPQRPQVYSAWLAIPAVVHQLLPYPPTQIQIVGVTKDETGAATAGFTVYLFDMSTGTPVLMQTTVSDATGTYRFPVRGDLKYWAVSYKAGTPDKAGATRNDLTGAAS